MRRSPVPGASIVTGLQDFYALHGPSTSLVVDCRSHAPSILYWGARLHDVTTPSMLAVLATRQEAQARVEQEVPIALSPSLSAGFPGRAGILAHRDGRDWAIHATLRTVNEGPQSLRLLSQCDSSGVQVTHEVSLDGDVLVASTTITNTADDALSVERCSAPSIPLPLDYDTIRSFRGRWSKEFQVQTVPRFAGIFLRENRSGRTSHDTFPGICVHESNATESAGNVYALHLGWSGNHSTLVEELSDGRAYAQLGELLHPGEVVLEKGASYTSPSLYGTHSDKGFSGASRSLHKFVRNALTDARMAGKQKLVHYNTWEAVYFDLEVDKLKRLADAAAETGAERFVLDDGWFRGRRSDDAGLGDWFVDESIFPDGLEPLVEHVNGLGLEFGLWVEPEMVNTNSDLFREHPDWVLDASPAPAAMARNQLVLDLTRAEVCEYLYERIDALLSEYAITYLKWDMNRDLSQPGGYDGRIATHRQTRALYSLLQRVRAAHPSVEIESCSSGGGRADYGILGHTDRVWTSDSNDALDRLSIQRGFSQYFPPEFMGAHVGPARCHITGRVIDMETRAAVALFGDMGVEADILDMDEDDRRVLADAIALHKQYRKLIFGGDLFRVDTPDHEDAFGIVAGDAGEALFSYVLLGSTPHSAPGRYRFAGLKPATRYRVEVVWPVQPKSFSAGILEAIDDAVVSGEALMQAGVQLPILEPQSALVFRLVAVD